MKCARKRRGAKPSVNGSRIKKRNMKKKGKRGRRVVLNNRKAERGESKMQRERKDL